MQEKLKPEPVWTKKLNSAGQEVPDPRPRSIPVKVRRPPTRIEEFRKYLQMESLMAASRGFETLEESDDFDVDDEFDPTSPYEEHFDHLENAMKDKRDFYERKKKKWKGAPPPSSAYERVSRKYSDVPKKVSDDSSSVAKPGPDVKDGVKHEEV